MSTPIESNVEDALLAWLEAVGYVVLQGTDIAAGESGAERSDPNYCDVVLKRIRAVCQCPWQTQVALGEYE